MESQSCDSRITRRRILRSLASTGYNLGRQRRCGAACSSAATPACPAPRAARRRSRERQDAQSLPGYRGSECAICRCWHVQVHIRLLRSPWSRAVSSITPADGRMGAWCHGAGHPAATIEMNLVGRARSARSLRLRRSSVAWLHR
jgi:hypothetical protein